jgi:hypothetical protein
MAGHYGKGYPARLERVKTGRDVAAMGAIQALHDPVSRVPDVAGLRKDSPGVARGPGPASTRRRPSPKDPPGDQATRRTFDVEVFPLVDAVDRSPPGLSSDMGAPHPSLTRARSSPARGIPPCLWSAASAIAVPWDDRCLRAQLDTPYAR